eukprot:CAMPEP_0175135236 /NCGR_PEP_ID=MMETSP0087-20121206/8608_1 /TAXON_ID=136419 /ORGANISM="Unknown Unknown, Strain D1" /LENGTH=1563 /DNA_ID=CAMNT_0016417859 /DNA_START=35 /DNA_END=4722 /DNA_ORIENTATION=-
MDAMDSENKDAWLLNTPQQWHKLLKQDSARQLKVILEKLQSCVDLHDYKGARYYAQRLRNYLENKFPLTLEERESLVNLMMELVVACNDVANLSRFSYTLGLLLKREKRLKVTIPWRPLYEKLLRFFFVGAHQLPEATPSIKQTLGSCLTRLIKRARKYFPPEAAEEILLEFMPNLCPLDEAYFKNQSLLCIFLPATKKTSATLKERVPEILKAMSLVDKCSESTLCWFKLICRMAKYDLDSWAGHVSTLLTVFLQQLKLPIGKSKSSIPSFAWNNHYTFLLMNNRSTTDELCVAVGKLVVFTLNKDSKTLQTFEALLDSMYTFFHPSNHGGWSVSLGTLLMSCSYFYVERLRKEDTNAESLTHSADQFLDRNDTAFAAILQKFAMLQLYSKSRQAVSMAITVLKDCSFVFPQLILPSLLDQFLPNLQNASQAHRMLSTFEGLTMTTNAMFGRKNYPESSAFLQQLMYAALPGIDPVDPLKSARTLGWLEILFFNIPFVQAGEKAGETDNSPGDDDARTLTFCFSDWSREFLDKMLSLLECMETYTGGSGGKSKASHMDKFFGFAIKRVTDAFFSALSAKIFEEACDKVCTYVLGCHKNAVQSFFAYLVSSMALANPAVLLAKLVPPLCQKLANNPASSEKEWYLTLLAAAVQKAGPRGEVLNYLEAVQKTCLAVREEESKDESSKKGGGEGKASKLATAVMASLVKGLTTVYPNERKAFSSAVWQDEASWQSWRVWGQYKELEQYTTKGVNIDWHFPSSAEFKAAEGVVREQLSQPLSVLQATAQADAADQIDITAVTGSLRVVLAFVKASANVLGTLDGEEVDVHPKKNGEVEFERMTLSPLFPCIKSSLSDNASLRTEVCDTVYAAAANMLKHFGGLVSTNVKLWNKVVKVVHALTALYGPGESEHQDLAMGASLRMYKFHHKNRLEDKYKCLLRPVLVDKAYLRLSKKLMSFSSNQCYNSRVKANIMFLQKLTLSDFEGLRHKAEHAVTSCCRLFPLAIDPVLDNTFTALSSADSTDKQVIGAAKLLANQQQRVWIVNKLRRFSSFVLALCQHGMQHQDDLVQTALHEVFLQYFSHAVHHPLSVQPVEACARVSPEVAEQRNQGLAKMAQHNTATYHNLIQGLVKIANTAGTHWRYQLMSSALLGALGKEECMVPSQVLTLAKGLLDDVEPIRRVCVMAVTRLLKLHTRRSAAAAADSEAAACARGQEEVSAVLGKLHTGLAGLSTSASLNADTWHSAQLCDSNMSGWTGSSLTYKTYRSSPPQAKRAKISADADHQGWLDASTVSELSQFLCDNLPAVLATLEHNHPTLSKMGDNAGSNKGAGVTIAAQCYHDPAITWPFCRLSLDSNGFDKTHVGLITAMVRAFPSLLLSPDDKATGPLFKQFTELCQDPHEEEKQCTAAEVFAGIVKGSRHWAPTQQLNIQQALLGGVLKTLSACQPNCVKHWQDALRGLSSNSDPRRLMWLFQPLLQGAFQTPPATEESTSDSSGPSIVARQFKFVFPLLAEGGWRAQAISHWVVDKLRQQPGWLQHPYKQVRDAVATLLFLCTRSYTTAAAAAA